MLEFNRATCPLLPTSSLNKRHHFDITNLPLILSLFRAPRALTVHIALRSTKALLASANKDDSNIQLPIPPPSDTPLHLHIDLHPRNIPDNHGSKQGRRDGHLLEVGADRRAAESVCLFGVPGDGGMCISLLSGTLPRPRVLRGTIKSFRSRLVGEAVHYVRIPVADASSRYRYSWDEIIFGV